MPSCLSLAVSAQNTLEKGSMPVDMVARELYHSYGGDPLEFAFTVPAFLSGVGFGVYPPMVDIRDLLQRGGVADEAEVTSAFTEYEKLRWFYFKRGSVLGVWEPVEGGHCGQASRPTDMSLAFRAHNEADTALTLLAQRTLQLLWNPVQSAIAALSRIGVPIFVKRVVMEEEAATTRGQPALRGIYLNSGTSEKMSIHLPVSTESRSYIFVRTAPPACVDVWSILVEDEADREALASKGLPRYSAPLAPTLLSFGCQALGGRMEGYRKQRELHAILTKDTTKVWQNDLGDGHGIVVEPGVLVECQLPAGAVVICIGEKQGPEIGPLFDWANYTTLDAERQRYAEPEAVEVHEPMVHSFPYQQHLMVQKLSPELANLLSNFVEAMARADPTLQRMRLTRDTLSTMRHTGGEPLAENTSGDLVTRASHQRPSYKLQDKTSNAIARVQAMFESNISGATVTLAQLTSTVESIFSPGGVSGGEDKVILETTEASKDLGKVVSSYLQLLLAVNSLRLRTLCEKARKSWQADWSSLESLKEELDRIGAAAQLEDAGDRLKNECASEDLQRMYKYFCMKHSKKPCTIPDQAELASRLTDFRQWVAEGCSKKAQWLYFKVADAGGEEGPEWWTSRGIDKGTGLVVIRASLLNTDLLKTLILPATYNCPWTMYHTPNDLVGRYQSNAFAEELFEGIAPVPIGVKAAKGKPPYNSVAKAAAVVDAERATYDFLMDIFGKSAVVEKGLYDNVFATILSQASTWVTDCYPVLFKLFGLQHPFPTYSTECLLGFHCIRCCAVYEVDDSAEAFVCRLCQGFLCTSCMEEGGVYTTDDRLTAALSPAPCDAIMADNNLPDLHTGLCPPCALLYRGFIHRDPALVDEAKAMTSKGKAKGWRPAQNQAEEPVGSYSCVQKLLDMIQADIDISGFCTLCGVPEARISGGLRRCMMTPRCTPQSRSGGRGTTTETVPLRGEDVKGNCLSKMAVCGKCMPKGPQQKSGFLCVICSMLCKNPALADSHDSSTDHTSQTTKLGAEILGRSLPISLGYHRVEARWCKPGESRIVINQKRKWDGRLELHCSLSAEDFAAKMTTECAVDTQDRQEVTREAWEFMVREVRGALKDVVIFGTRQRLKTHLDLILKAGKTSHKESRERSLKITRVYSLLKAARTNAQCRFNISMRPRFWSDVS